MNTQVLALRLRRLRRVREEILMEGECVPLELDNAINDLIDAMSDKHHTRESTDSPLHQNPVKKPSGNAHFGVESLKCSQP